LVVGEKVTLK